MSTIASAPTLGVEEEIMVIDRTTFAPAVPHPACVAELKKQLGERVALEYKAGVIELVTGVHRDVFALVEEAGASRYEAHQVLTRFGYAGLPMALHPWANALELPAREGERYRKIERQKGDAVRGLAAQGVHLHVGTFDIKGPERLALLPALMHFAPIHAAITAASPFWAFHDTDQASWRQRILMQLASGLPLAAADLGELERLSAAFAQAGGPADASEHWGLVRLGAGKPTIEFRAFDTAASLDAIPWQAALTAAAVHAGRCGTLPAPTISPAAAAWVCATNLDRAAADGSDAQLVDPYDLKARSVNETLEIWKSRLAATIDTLGYGDAIALMPASIEAPARAQRALVAEAEAQALLRGLLERDARQFALRQLVERALIEAAATPAMPWALRSRAA